MSTPKKKAATAAPQMALTDAAPQGGDTLQASVQLPKPIEMDTRPEVLAIQQFTIVDHQSYVALATQCATLGARWEQIEKQRVDMKAPALEMSRKVDAFFQPVLKALDEARRVGRSKLEAWDAEQRRIAAQKQREADELARKEREEKERQARLERERTQKAMNAINEFNALAAAAAKAESLNAMEFHLSALSETRVTEEVYGDHTENVLKAHDSAATSIRQSMEKFKQLQAQREQAQNAEESAAVDRALALAARQAQLKAERDRERAEADNKRLREESEARALKLEQDAATTVAPTVSAELAQVEGMSRAKTYTWKLTDKSKVKPEYLILDTKAIDALVRSAKERAAEIVGGIEVELSYTNRMK